MQTFAVRPFQADDSAAGDGVLATAFAGADAAFPEAHDARTLGLARLAQTGHRVLVAEDAAGLAGVVRWREEEGLAWFDLLAAARAGAGPVLVRAVERAAQDGGLRLVRTRVPAGSRCAGFLGWRGYVPVAREAGAAGRAPRLVLEKRLPLLTVREQRRSDADAIAALTGEDPWPFTQGQRPGWFVLADGERVAGAVAVREASRGTGEARGPWLAPAYRGRGLEAWMLERAALYAETNGMVTVAAAASAALDALRRELEERRWFREGQGAAAFYRKQLTGRPLAEREPWA
ncbi:MAG: hypothetical protein IT304_01065 [Dehalococcoidia bacterium]|nr:hypothetical protein [Dehalococcoidia bacterium]